QITLQAIAQHVQLVFFALLQLIANKNGSLVEGKISESARALEYRRQRLATADGKLAGVAQLSSERDGPGQLPLRRLLDHQVIVGLEFQVRAGLVAANRCEIHVDQCGLPSFAVDDLI